MTRSPQDAAEAGRRHVYIEGLYAKPMGGILAQCPSYRMTCILQGCPCEADTVKADAKQTRWNQLMQLSPVPLQLQSLSNA